MYGDLGSATSSSAAQLSRVMIDYWVSFATSLNPNDGHGVSRSSIFFTAHGEIGINYLHLGSFWEQYTPQHQVSPPLAVNTEESKMLFCRH